MNYPIVISLTRMIQEGQTNNIIISTLINGGHTYKEIFVALRETDEYLIDNEVITMNGSLSMFNWFDNRLDKVRQLLSN